MIWIIFNGTSTKSFSFWNDLLLSKSQILCIEWDYESHTSWYIVILLLTQFVSHCPCWFIHTTLGKVESRWRFRKPTDRFVTASRWWFWEVGVSCRPGKPVRCLCSGGQCTLCQIAECVVRILCAKRSARQGKVIWGRVCVAGLGSA